MKRTDRGAKTFSTAANTPSKDSIRLSKIQSLPTFFGSGLWEGDLSQMPEDRKPRPNRSR